MAKPSTRQGLIDYCFRRLGAPVLEINVDDDQVDDLVDDAIQFYNERHFDGVERMYLKYQLTQDDIDRGRAGGAGGVHEFCRAKFLPRASGGHDHRRRYAAVVQHAVRAAPAVLDDGGASDREGDGRPMAV